MYIVCNIILPTVECGDLLISDLLFEAEEIVQFFLVLFFLRLINMCPISVCGQI